MTHRVNELCVLVVDDHQMVRDAIADLVRDQGANVVVAENAVAALKVLNSLAMDVVVSDIEMPGRDGFWLIQELRSNPSLRSIPAIALTGRGPDDRRRILDAGFSAHLVKPVDATTLWATIQALRLRAAG